MRRYKSNKLKRSNAGHNNSLRRLNNLMISKNGFYKKGEFNDLEKRRMYHIAAYEKQVRFNRVLTRNEKTTLWNSIQVNHY